MIRDYFWEKVSLLQESDPDIGHNDIQYEVWYELSPNRKKLVLISHHHCLLNDFNDELVKQFNEIEQARKQYFKPYHLSGNYEK